MDVMPVFLVLWAIHKADGLKYELDRVRMPSTVVCEEKLEDLYRTAYVGEHPLWRIGITCSKSQFYAPNPKEEKLS